LAWNPFHIRLPSPPSRNGSCSVTAIAASHWSRTLRRIQPPIGSVKPVFGRLMTASGTTLPQAARSRALGGLSADCFMLPGSAET